MKVTKTGNGFKKWTYDLVCQKRNWDNVKCEANLHFSMDDVKFYRKDHWQFYIVCPECGLITDMTDRIPNTVKQLIKATMEPDKKMKGRIYNASANENY